MLQSLQRILAVLALALALPAMAQSDPPARVGRLGYIENQVDFRIDRNQPAGPATLNWPVSSGAVLETGQHGRAEVWVGSTAYRIAEDSQVEFSVVDDARVDVRVNGGSLAVSILDRDQVDDVLIATPDGNVRFLTPGRYRIDVLGDRSELSVQAGRATFDDGQRATAVAAGQKASRWSDGNVQLDADRAHDNFDRWVANRENATLAGPSRRYVSPNMTGYQDLDAYGDWQTAPDYGSVWYPRAVADDWAPYRYGRWAWVAPWGWTWVDQAPWGFAPFHYGRWAIIKGRWGWIPGRIVARPVYAPALVAWIGNPGWSVGFRAGAAPAVGWFPLAPREVYVPAHHHSTTYVRQVNLAYVRDVSVIDRAARGGPQAPFANHGSSRAVTVVPANIVREGHAITGREIQGQQRQDLGRAPPARHAPSADWLSPRPGAFKPNDPDRGAARSDPNQRNADRSALRQSMPEAINGREVQARRDAWRGTPDTRPGVDSRGRPADVVPGTAPQRREAVPTELRQPVTDPVQPQSSDGRSGAFRRPGEVAQPARDSFGRPEVELRGRSIEQGSAPMRRDLPAAEGRSDERQTRSAQQLEWEQRRELQRMDRHAPPTREREVAPVVRQPENARPAPEVTMPTSQPRLEPQRPMVQDFRAPPPQQAPAPMPQPRLEPQRPPVQDFRAPPPQQAPAPMPQPRLEPQRPPVQEFRAPPPQQAPAPMPQPRLEPQRPPVQEFRAPPPQQAPAPMPQPRLEPQRPPVQNFRAPPPQQAPAPMPQPRLEPQRPPVQEFRAPPAPAPMPLQRVEQPRQQPQQGGGQPDPRRRHGDDERGGR